jgi:hypothetical protein
MNLLEDTMSETNENRNSRQTERALRTLNQAFIATMKKYKKNHGQLPQDSYHFVLRDGMTYEEELLEIFHALVRSGISPDEAREQASAELEGIHALIKEHEEHNS